MSEDVVKSLGLGAPFHIGIAVYDIEAAIERYGKAFGITDWRLRDVSGAGMKIAFSVTEFPWLEFIQPRLDVESSATKHLREHGEGVFHVAYFVDEDLPELLKRAEALGVPREDIGPSGSVAYLDPGGANGLRVELVPKAIGEKLKLFVRTGEWTL